MLQTIVIIAVALAILWPFIRLAYELIKLAGSLGLLAVTCILGAAVLAGRGACALFSALRRHAGTKMAAPETAAMRDRTPDLPEYSSVR